MNVIVRLPDTSPRRAGRYLECTGHGGWRLCDASGPIRDLNKFESRIVCAAYLPPNARGLELAELREEVLMLQGQLKTAQDALQPLRKVLSEKDCQLSRWASFEGVLRAQAAVMRNPENYEQSPEAYAEACTLQCVEAWLQGPGYAYRDRLPRPKRWRNEPERYTLRELWPLCWAAVRVIWRRA